jgi:hypothetical protein
MSYGRFNISELENQLMKKLYDLGVTLVAAGGNEIQDACGHYPGASPHVIQVGATNVKDHKFEFSNHGRCGYIIFLNIIIKKNEMCQLC